MTKRTKRYGGFLIGDRVRVKDTAKTSCKGSGRVIAYNGPMLVVESYPMKGMIHEFAPRQLINLTRIEEEYLVSKSLMNEKLKNQRDIEMARDFVDEALRQTEIFLSPLSLCGDPLPSPYTRDVYTTTKDY